MVYVPPLADEPFEYEPEPTTPKAEPDELEVVVLEELDFFEPHPAASAASASTTAPSSANRRYFLIRDFSFLGDRSSPLGPHVEGIAQPVAEKVERESRDDQKRAREQHEPPGD